jgi:hypothetical protein
VKPPGYISRRVAEELGSCAEEERGLEDDKILLEEEKGLEGDETLTEEEDELLEECKDRETCGIFLLSSTFSVKKEKDGVKSL